MAKRGKKESRRNETPQQRAAREAAQDVGSGTPGGETARQRKQREEQAARVARRGRPVAPSIVVPPAMQDIINSNTGGQYPVRPSPGYPAPNKPVNPGIIPDPVTGVTPGQQAVIDAGGTITPAPGAVDPVTGLPTDAPGTAPTGPTQAEKDKAAQDERDAQAAREKQEQTDKANRNSRARLDSTLNEYGLGDLSDTVWTWIVEGLSEPEIIQRLRGTDRYKQRFVGMEARRKKGLAPISEAQYIAYERDARQLMRAAGLPSGFFDANEDFTRFIENDLSISELSDRVTLAANAAFRMPKEDRDALSRWGMGPGDLTAYWLDPDKAQPLLERKYAAAQLAGTSSRTKFGDLDERTATNLATMGVTAQQAEQGFGTLVESRELFGQLERGEETFGQDEQLDAVFGGNANARRRIEQQRRRRQARFESGGGFVSSQTGLAGLGDTNG